MNAEVLLPLWQYALLLLTATLLGGLGGALALHAYQEVQLRREVDRWLQLEWPQQEQAEP